MPKTKKTKTPDTASKDTQSQNPLSINVEIHSRLKNKSSIANDGATKHNRLKPDIEAYLQKITNPQTPGDLILALRDPLSPAYKEMMNMIAMDLMISEIVETLIIKYLIQEFKLSEKEKDEMREKWLARDMRNQLFLQESAKQLEFAKQVLAHSEQLFHNVNHYDKPKILYAMYVKHEENIVVLQKRIDDQTAIIAKLQGLEKQNNDIKQIAEEKKERIAEFKEDVKKELKEQLIKALEKLEDKQMNVGHVPDPQPGLKVFDPAIQGFREIKLDGNDKHQDNELADKILEEVFVEPAPRELVQVLSEAFKGQYHYKPEPRKKATPGPVEQHSKESSPDKVDAAPIPPPPPPGDNKNADAAPFDPNQGLMNPVFEKLPINLAIEKGIRLGFKTAGIKETDQGKHEQALGARILEGLRENKPQVNAATKLKGIDRFLTQKKISIEMVEAELERKRCELLKNNEEKLLNQTAERYEKMTGNPIASEKQAVSRDKKELDEPDVTKQVKPQPNTGQT